MNVAARISLLLFVLSTWGASVQADDRLICCGGPEVFIISAASERSAPDDRLWRWQAKDSPELPDEMRAQFRTTDECKPYGDKLLVTSSSGGVALLERKDKRCLFFTSVKNAHSACLLPEHRVAVASSTGGDEIFVFDATQSGEQIAPLARLSLKGAHGAVWDEKRELLWALGTHELLLVKVDDTGGRINLAVNDRWKLPTAGGHDLSWARNRRHLFVTSNEAVYRFDTEEHSFKAFEPLANSIAVKSIDEHPKSGRIVYHQADHEQKVWWSDTIRLLHPAGTIQLPAERLYKIRWDVARDK